MKKKDIKTVNVLGENYTITHASVKEDPELKDLSGYCVTADKRIVIEADDLKRLTYAERWVLRHELVHAFMHESGIDKECFSSTEQEEALVDWIAIQFPKMLKAMQEIDAL